MPEADVTKPLDCSAVSKICAVPTSPLTTACIALVVGITQRHVGRASSVDLAKSANGGISSGPKVGYIPLLFCSTSSRSSPILTVILLASR